MATWVITHSGETAWNWSNPAESVALTNADAFAAEMEAKGVRIIDDRKTIPSQDYSD